MRGRANDADVSVKRTLDTCCKGELFRVCQLWVCSVQSDDGDDDDEGMRMLPHKKTRDTSEEQREEQTPWLPHSKDCCCTLVFFLIFNYIDINAFFIHMFSF